MCIRDSNKSYFDSLVEQRESIESEFGTALEWERLDDKRACRIAIYRDGSIDASSEEVQEIKDWAVQHLLKLRDVFGHRA